MSLAKTPFLNMYSYLLYNPEPLISPQGWLYVCCVRLSLNLRDCFQRRSKENPIMIIYPLWLMRFTTQVRFITDLWSCYINIFINFHRSSYAYNCDYFINTGLAKDDASIQHVQNIQQNPST